MLSTYILLRNKILYSKASVSNNVLPPSSFRGKWMHSVVGLGACYLIYSEVPKGKRESNYYKSLKKKTEGRIQYDYKSRLRDTFAYFIGGVGSIAALTAILSSNPSLLDIMNTPLGSIAPLPLSLLSLIALRSNNLRVNSFLRKALFTCYYAGYALLIAPIVSSLGKKLTARSLLWTGACCGVISFMSYFTKETKHLKLTGALNASMGAFFFIGASNAILRSNRIESFYLYGGLAFYTGMTLFTLKNIVLKAKYQLVFDPLAEAIDLIVYTFNIFVHIARIVYDHQ